MAMLNIQMVLTEIRKMPFAHVVKDCFRGSLEFRLASSLDLGVRVICQLCCLKISQRLPG